MSYQLRADLLNLAAATSGTVLNKVIAAGDETEAQLTSNEATESTTARRNPWQLTCPSSKLPT